MQYGKSNDVMLCGRAGTELVAKGTDYDGIVYIYEGATFASTR